MSEELPFEGRDSAHLQGHWLLARLGKRVLRPGGRELTERLIADSGIAGADVVELAPGLGRTAVEILALAPSSYRGVENDAAAVKLTEKALAGRGVVLEGEAAATGLEAESADVVVGEAMLTMQSEKQKKRIVDEAFRVLRPGGCYAIHELAIEPVTVPDEVKREIQQSLARAIKVNARPLTESEWKGLLTEAGFEVATVGFAAMALLQPRRLLADEGLLGTLRFVKNVAKDADARKRVLTMRSTFTKYKRNLVAIEVVATKPEAKHTAKPE